MKLKRLVRPWTALGLAGMVVTACGTDDGAGDAVVPSGGSGGASSGATSAAGAGGVSTGGNANQAGASIAGNAGQGGASMAGNTGSGGAADAAGAAGHEPGGGAPEVQGGAGGDSTQGGAGGEPAEPPPFAGPYGVVYAAPVQGVTTRFPQQVQFRAGGLIRWTSELGDVHDLGTAKNLNVGLGGVVQWGRWADGWLAGNDQLELNAKQGFHYGIGTLSAGLPPSGTRSYALVGATPVTVGDGSVDVGSATASATAAFGATTTVGVAIQLNIGGLSYGITSTGGTATPADSEVTAGDVSRPYWIGGAPPRPKTGICADTCSLSVQGFFAGVEADQLVLVVHLYDVSGGSPTSISSVLVLGQP